ncbi:ABC transporter permease [Alicyclobacillus acidiphilus]|uniref:ABC transporter permease n=1 Tax=Alicyclobacillus acidiphilus TaxID=182455 RepID=UPI0009F9B9AA
MLTAISPDLPKLPDEPQLGGRQRGRTQNRALATFFRGIALPLVAVAVWQLIGSMGWVQPVLLPSPFAILKAFVQLGQTGELWRDLGISVFRVVVGFVIGGGLGLLAGIGAGLWKGVEQVLDPTFQTLRTIPHLAITPLFILWFGLGESSKISLIAFGAFFPLYINAFMGIRNVDRKLFDVTRVLDFSRRQQLVKLVIPGAMPNILIGLRLSLGVAWLTLIVAELMGSNSGVGYLIENATQFSQTSYVFVGIVIFAVVGKLSDSLVRMFERRLLQWRDTYSG